MKARNQDKKASLFDEICVKALQNTTVHCWIVNPQEPGKIIRAPSEDVEITSMVGIVIPCPNHGQHGSLLSLIKNYFLFCRNKSDLYKEVYYVLPEDTEQTEVSLLSKHQNFIRGDMFSSPIQYFCLARSAQWIAPIGDTTGENVSLKISSSYLACQFKKAIESSNLTGESFENQLIGFIEYGLQYYTDNYPWATVSNSQLDEQNKILTFISHPSDVRNVALMRFILTRARAKMLTNALVCTSESRLIPIDEFVASKYDKSNVRFIYIFSSAQNCKDILHSLT